MTVFEDCMYDDDDSKAVIIANVHYCIIALINNKLLTNWKERKRTVKIGYAKKT